MTRRDLALVLQGLWFRRWVSLAVLAVASLVVGAAVTGPLFLRAAQESVLRDTLSQGVTSGRGVADFFSGPVSDDPVRQVQERDAEKVADRPTLARLLGPPVSALQTTLAGVEPGAGGERVVLAWREGACAHVRMVTGTCAEQPGTVMVSAATSALESWPAGLTLDLGVQRVTVAGTYVPLDPTGDYWGGHPYFVAYAGAGGPAYGGPTGSGLDTVLGSRATVEAQGPDASTQAVVDRQIDLDRIRVTDIAALEPELVSWTAVDPSGIEGDTALAVVLLEAQTVVDALTLPVLVVEAQLLVLCWLVLFLVVANAAEARGPEVALAKLRGVGVGATVAFGLLDTLLLVVLAVPVGFVLAWGWTVALARWQLAPGVPVILTYAAGWAAVGAGAGAVVGAVLAPPGPCADRSSSSGGARAVASAPGPGWSTPWWRSSPSSGSSPCSGPPPTARLRDRWRSSPRAWSSCWPPSSARACSRGCAGRRTGPPAGAAGWRACSRSGSWAGARARCASRCCSPWPSGWSSSGSTPGPSRATTRTTGPGPRSAPRWSSPSASRPAPTWPRWSTGSIRAAARSRP